MFIVVQGKLLNVITLGQSAGANKVAAQASKIRKIRKANTANYVDCHFCSYKNFEIAVGINKFSLCICYFREGVGRSNFTRSKVSFFTRSKVLFTLD